MPEVFNSFFVNKISKIREKFDSHGNTDLISQSGSSQFVGSHLSESFSCDEVKKIIMSSSPKSCSLDTIPTQFLFQHIDILIDCLTSIINDSLLSGVMPLCFRKAIISPLINSFTTGFSHQNCQINLRNFSSSLHFIFCTNQNFVKSFNIAYHCKGKYSN